MNDQMSISQFLTLHLAWFVFLSCISLISLLVFHAWGQVQDIEFMQIEMKVIEGLKVGNDCLKSMHEVGIFFILFRIKPWTFSVSAPLSFSYGSAHNKNVRVLTD